MRMRHYSPTNSKDTPLPTTHSNNKKAPHNSTTRIQAHITSLLSHIATNRISPHDTPSLKAYLVQQGLVSVQMQTQIIRNARTLLRQSREPQLTSAQLSKIESHVRASPHLANHAPVSPPNLQDMITTLCSELQSQDHSMPHRRLFHAVRNLVRIWDLKRVTEEHLTFIRRHVEELEHPQDIDQIITELRSSLPSLSDYSLRTTIRNELKRYALSHVDGRTKTAIRQYLDKMQRADASVPEIAAEMQNALKLHKIPKDAIQELVYRFLRTKTISETNLSHEQHQYIHRHMEGSQHPFDVDRNMDELVQVPLFSDLPRAAILRQVRLYVRGAGRTALTKSQKEDIQQHVEQSKHPYNIPVLCEEIKELFSLPSTQLVLYLVRNISAQVAMAKLNTEQYTQIKEHVEQSKHTDMATICNEVQDMVPDDFPLNALSALVRRFMVSTALQNISDEMRDQIRNHVEQSKHPNNIVQLCNELHGMEAFKNVPRKALYTMVINSSVAVIASRLSEEQKQAIVTYLQDLHAKDRKFVQTPACDALMELPVLRGVPRHVLNEFVNRFKKAEARKRKENRKLESQKQTV